MLDGDHVRADQILVAHGGNIIIKASREKEILNRAGVEAQSWCNEIEGKCRKVLMNVQHAATYNADAVRQQLGAVVRGQLIDTPEGSLMFAARGRRMKIRDEAAYRKWQAEKVPFVKQTREGLLRDVAAQARKDAANQRLAAWERQRARELAARMERAIAGKAPLPRRLDPKLERTHVRTLRNQEFNARVIEDAVADDEIAYLQWTTARDTSVCGICEDHDGWIVGKGEDAVGIESPPLHYNCRCLWMQVSKTYAATHKVKPTAKKDWPEEEPAEGFGGLPASARG